MPCSACIHRSPAAPCIQWHFWAAKPGVQRCRRVIEALPACVDPAEAWNAQGRFEHSLCYEGPLSHHLPLLPPTCHISITLTIHVLQWQVHERAYHCVLKYVSWWEDVALDEAGFVVTWGRSLAQYKRKAHPHGVSHHQQCLVSSSVFLEVTVLFTSCSVCSIPRENYRPHVWEGERKGKESPQKSYYCLQLWGCHARGLSGLCCHLWLVHTHWTPFGWRCVHGLCSRR